MIPLKLTIHRPATEQEMQDQPELGGWRLLADTAYDPAGGRCAGYFGRRPTLQELRAAMYYIQSDIDDLLGAQ